LSGSSVQLVRPLRDGTVAILRPLGPEDRDRVRRALDGLSGATRYARFFAHVERFSSTQLDYLTTVDQHSHIAWIATDAGSADVPAAGFGRFVRVPDEPETAELAITIVDAYQQRWLGTTMLGLLYHRARAGGIRTLRCYVPPVGGAFADRLRRLGAVARLRDGLVELDLPVYDDPAYLPKNPVGDRLRQLLDDFDASFARTWRDRRSPTRARVA